jgi:preprotein translocase subunit SecF
VVAALLTLVGYSMNDTIVVFDRIRENLKILRREKLERLINISVNQTLSRTVLTSGLTLITALSLWLFGGEVLNGFSFALVWGIIFGTYSSVFIASPILIFGQNLVDQRKAQSSGGARGPKAPEVLPASVKTPSLKTTGVKPPAGKPSRGQKAG